MKTMISNTRSLSGRGHRLHLQADRQLYYPISFFSIPICREYRVRRYGVYYLTTKVLYGIRARVVWLCDSSIYGFARTKVKNRRAQRLNVSAHMVSAIIYIHGQRSPGHRLSTGHLRHIAHSTFSTTARIAMPVLPRSSLSLSHPSIVAFFRPGRCFYGRASECAPQLFTPHEGVFTPRSLET